MIYRLARPEDIEAVAVIYQHTHDCEEAGETTIGWIRSIYPTRETAEAALERGDLYVCEADSGEIVASAVINQIQVDVYSDVEWEYPADDSEVLVLHTLVVEPKMKAEGIGRGFVEYYEECGRRTGCRYLRMDTNERNKAARKFYAGLGYREAGIVPTVFNGIPGVNLVMLEKKV